ncbi:VWA domain-containing protein [Acidocella sp. KAb 2-4]|uniref:vWA domain-containing protein n=1 Tax=Acidocella sp. KAb 2-4 TaxID=2885158 RepID=UPI001D07AD10|nr:VWA domain-containing protein [Acidocella sp. KAb 2-4]MCB5944748.1 VWA domain-containing protein [Acidocella sp. KAb 2-4]
MFLAFFLALRAAGVKASLREFLTLQEAMRQGLAGFDAEHFYYLARATLVKDERFLDKFDAVFAEHFKGVLQPRPEAPDEVAPQELPREWLEKLAERLLSDEEKAQIEALGGFEKLMETLRQRLAEQQGRHQGGNKWIGTAGTSPFGAHGYNPEGVRIGQQGSRHKSAVKVWDKREFRNLAGDAELGTRNMKIALRRLRRFAREGAAEELDLAGTIRSTARNAGYLDLQMVPERHNAVKLLLLLDIGGSMDEHVHLCEQLFTAASSEFKHLKHLYFHNCPYEMLWKDARMHAADAIPTLDVLHTYDHTWKLVFVGDAAMSPYELISPGGAISSWSQESGKTWLTRILHTYPKAAWINPVPENLWQHTQTTRLIAELMERRMYGLTLEGLDQAMRRLMQ